MELSEGVTGREFLHSHFKKLRKKRAVAEGWQKRGELTQRSVVRRGSQETRCRGEGERVANRGERWKIP